MDKFENRRIRLIELKDNFCNGKISELAKKLGRSDSYVSRMLYPDDKDGKKRIGDDMVDVIAQTFNVSKSWLDGNDVYVQQDNNFGTLHHSGSLNGNPPNFKMPDNSLAPLIPMQSELWVDTHDTEIIDEKIYLLEYGGMKLFRQIFRQPENHIKLVAYNSQYDIFVAPIDKVQILGRVISWKVEDLK